MISLDRILRLGVKQFFGGTRRGQPLVAALGAAVMILSWLRKRGSEDRLLFGETLEEGETMQITFRRGGLSDSATIEG